MQETTKIFSVILAGGSGSRMKSQIPKQFLDLNGKPVLQYSIEAFEKSLSDYICIAVNEMYRKDCESILSSVKSKKFCGFADNGSERIWSVKNALEKIVGLSREQGIEEKNIFVLIHDGARPLVSTELINRCIKEVKDIKACIATTDVKDTIKTVDNNGKIITTPERKTLKSAQTPQCFRLDIILRAYRAFEEGDKKTLPTDDASLVETFTDTNVYTIEGDEKNIKITTPDDMIIAKAFLK